MRLTFAAMLVLLLLFCGEVAAAPSAPSAVSFTESCVVGSVSGKALKRIAGTCPQTGHTFARRTLLKLKAGDTIEIIGCSIKDGVILPCPVTLYGGM